eukprot:1194625-Prorocentrum_minimum.AAC.9
MSKHSNLQKTSNHTLLDCWFEYKQGNREPYKKNGCTAPYGRPPNPRLRIVAPKAAGVPARQDCHVRTVCQCQWNVRSPDLRGLGSDRSSVVRCRFSFVFVLPRVTLQHLNGEALAPKTIIDASTQTRANDGDNDTFECSLQCHAVALERADLCEDRTPAPRPMKHFYWSNARLLTLALAAALNGVARGAW